VSRSSARVSTDRPQRYAKQLASHLGRRIETSWSEEEGVGRLAFSDGATGTMTAAPDALLLEVEGPAEEIERLEDVVGRHLVRFGSKDELVVTWTREGGEPGLVHRRTED